MQTNPAVEQKKNVKWSDRLVHGISSVNNGTVMTTTTTSMQAKAQEAVEQQEHVPP